MKVDTVLLHREDKKSHEAEAEEANLRTGNEHRKADVETGPERGQAKPSKFGGHSDTSEMFVQRYRHSCEDKMLKNVFETCKNFAYSYLNSLLLL